jgi:hypothetical protein
VAQTPPVPESERLLQALRLCDDQIQSWLDSSQTNPSLLLEDPAAAAQAAASTPDLDLAVMRELEAVLTALARKLNLPESPCPETNADSALTRAPTDP